MLLRYIDHTRLYSEYQLLERHPIHKQWKIAIIKYLKRLNDLPEDRLAKKAYRQLILDYENISWLSVTNTIRQEHAIDVSGSVETIKSKINSTVYQVCSLLEWCFIISIGVSGDHSQLRCTGFAGSSVRAITWILQYISRSKAIKWISVLISVA